jgi:hypothetical protein
MRVKFTRRVDGEPLERLVDGFIFLSGGIFDLIERVGALADETGFGGKVRLHVVTRDLLDRAVESLADEFDPRELERAVEVLEAVTERIGREFYAHEYESRSG